MPLPSVNDVTYLDSCVINTYVKCPTFAYKGAFVKQLFKPGFDIATIELTEVEIIQAVVVKSNKKVNDEFFSGVDDYIKSKEKKVSPGMTKVYQHMRDRLKYFEDISRQKITFNRLNYDFYDKLVEFLSYNYVHQKRKEKLFGLKVNSIGQTIKQLSSFIKDIGTLYVLI